MAKTMADGTPLRLALDEHHVTLDRAQIRVVYRNEELRRTHQQARKESTEEFYRSDRPSVASQRRTRPHESNLGNLKGQRLLFAYR
jgi:hypothetical protein